MTSLFLLLFAVCFWSLCQSRSKSHSPNIVFFLIDDQDLLLNGMDSMPATMNIFAKGGLQFTNAFVSTPVCCVSRASILTGRYVHNHVTRNNSLAGDCSSKYWVTSHESSTYASILHDSNYKTFYTGKYLNLYGMNPGVHYSHVPAGWDSWYGLIGDSVYYDYKISMNGEYAEYHGTNPIDDYLPHVMRDLALDFLDNDLNHGSSKHVPFLMVLSFPSAHSPFIPANEYHVQVLEDDTLFAPRVDNFNYVLDNNGRGTVMKKHLDGMGEDEQLNSDLVFKLRHGTLMTVDDIISQLYTKINEMANAGMINEETYFMYASDHGFHLGQYGMSFGKKLLYETDLRIPFYVSGPKVDIGAISTQLALSIDIAPTIIDIANLYFNTKDPRILSMDGQSLVPHFLSSANADLDSNLNVDITASETQSFLVEYYGESKMEDTSNLNEQWLVSPAWNTHIIDVAFSDTWNNSFQCARILSDAQSVIYCQFICFDNDYLSVECDQQFTSLGEYYDLAEDADPQQLHNKYSLLKSSEIDEYNAIIAAMMKCSGQLCIEYRTLDWKTWNVQEKKQTTENAKIAALLIVVIAVVVLCAIVGCAVKLHFMKGRKDHQRGTKATLSSNSILFENEKNYDTLSVEYQNLSIHDGYDSL